MLFIKSNMSDSISKDPVNLTEQVEKLTKQNTTLTYPS